MQNTVAFVMTEMSSHVLIKSPLQFCTLLTMLQLSYFLTVAQQLQFLLFCLRLMRLEKYQNSGRCWISAPKHSDFSRHVSKSIKSVSYCYQSTTLSTPCRCIIVILCYGPKSLFNCTFNLYLFLWSCSVANRRGQWLWWNKKHRCLMGCDILHRNSIRFITHRGSQSVYLWLFSVTCV